jgi:HD-GYP domain-containing protein (c-di-GMP phosphodiesterase class II)
VKVHRLGAFVKRVLLIRVAAATLLIALAAGALTYFIQQDRLEREVADLGRQGIATLTRRVLDIVDQQQAAPLAALHQVLATAADAPVTYFSGRFVFVQFYDRAGVVLAEASAPGLAADDPAESPLDGLAFGFPAAGETQAETRRSGEGIYVICAMPLADRQGAARGYARGAFAVSAGALAAQQAAVRRSVLIVVGIVVAVTAILYPVILRLMRRLADYSTSLLDANLETLAVLGSAIAKRDADTDAHNYRVSLYAARLGEKIGLGADQMRGLIKGAFIHDVGKIGIADAILLKPGRLDEEEYRIMKTHVEKGVDIVGRSAWLRDSVPVVAAHHEKFGGGGYPADARGQAIPLPARIFAIADVFDALTSKRPYKDPLGIEETMAILEQGRGGHFDPALLDAFAGIAPELYDKYAGREGDALRQELVAVVDRYFSAGMESLYY